MAQDKRDPKGDRRTVRSQEVQKPLALQEHQDGLIRIDVSVHEAEQELGRALQCFVNFDHGYLKARRSPLGADLHLTWTWTLGAHSGSYVYVRVEFWRMSYGLQVLARKVFEVDEGKLRPSPDKRNPSRSPL